MIEKLLTLNRVRARVDARDWVELVDAVGAVMVAADDIEPSYVDAMKEVIREMGAYCVIAPGVVLLHARPEAGVKRLCIALATVSPGVNFGSPNDPVFVAFALGATDHESHIDLLSEMAKLLDDKRNIEVLKSVETAEDILSVIRTAAIPREPLKRAPGGSQGTDEVRSG